MPSEHASFVIGMIAVKSPNQYTISIIIAAFTTVIGLVLSYILSFVMPIGFYVLLIGAIILLLIGHEALYYRVINGCYGSNSHETKGILLFLVKNTSDPDTINRFENLSVFDALKRESEKIRDPSVVHKEARDPLTTVNLKNRGQFIIWIRRVIDALFLRNPIGTALGILIGAILYLLAAAFYPWLRTDPKIKIFDFSTLVCYTSFSLGAFLFNIPGLFRREMLPRNMQKILDAIEEGKQNKSLSDYQVRLLYRLLIEKNIEQASLAPEK